MKRIQIFVIFLLLNSAYLSAQFNLSSEISSMYDDNVDNNALKVKDQITIPSINLGYLFNDDKQEFNINYLYAYNFYSKNSSRIFHNHTLSTDYSRYLDKQEKTTLDLSLTADKRIGKAEFTVYDYILLSGKTSLRHQFKETSSGQITYNFSLINFTELTDFNYTEHMLSAKYSHQIFKQTAVILNTSLGGKFYINPGDTSSNTSSTRSSVIQSISSVRLGQGIWEGTGLSLMAQYQLNLQKETRYLSANYGAMSDDEIFDDHYGYEGLLLQGMLTQLLPFDTKVRFIFTTQGRLYSNLPAYDWLGYQIANQRKDTRTAYTLNITKSFESIGLEVDIAYDYITNKSNDPLYDYTNNAFTAIISVIF